jgi:DNA-binding GntR family transcriptional regulator
MPAREERVSITDDVFRRLRDQILTGELRQGSLHSIYECAETFGVSRTPVREAVLRLADMGMVVIERNRGFRVRGLSVDDVRAVFEFRLLVETTAVSYAAQHALPSLVEELADNLRRMQLVLPSLDAMTFARLDREFHDLITASLDNTRIRGELETLRGATYAMGVTTMGRPVRAREIHGEHAPIVDAIAGGDSLEAARCMARHLVHSGRVVMAEVAVRSGEVLPRAWPDFLPALLDPANPV